MAKKKPMDLHEFRSMGGKARKKALTPDQRKAIAKKAAETRWKKAKKPKGRKQ